MPSPLAQAGAVGAPSKFAPLHTNRFFTGLWTQRNPLRDAAVPFLYEKFYSGSRFDSIIDGLNVELTPRLTLARRCGHSVYNAQVFPAVNRFYEFRTFSTSAEIIHVMADCIGNVYDATGPNTKLNIWTKSAGAGSTYFQSVGNMLFMGNGVDQKKWVQSTLSWLAAHTFKAGQFIVDSNNNLQVAIGAQSLAITNIAITTNVCTMTFKTRAMLTFSAGMKLLLAGITTNAFLNGNTITISSVTYNQITFAFVHGNVAAVSDTGTASCAGGNTGGAAPAWGTNAGDITADNLEQWLCKGPSVQNWGTPTPASAPNVSNTPKPSAFNRWAADTLYSTSLSIVDSNGNVQKLTTGGVTGTIVPVWNVALGGITNDNAGGGTAVWTNMGSAARLNTTAYALGNLIQVTWTYWVTVPPSGGGGGYNSYALIPLLPFLFLGTHSFDHILKIVKALIFGAFGMFIIGPNQDGGDSFPVTVTAIWQCTTAGITAGSEPTWVDGAGATVPDGTVVWTNIGAGPVWVASLKVSLDQTVLDSNGNTQQITTSGKSSAVEPAWATTKGVSTIDNAATWINSGPYSGGNTAAWIYGYAFRCLLTQEVGTMSAESAPITLAANKIITVQGQASSDPKDDVVQIYRTAQGGSTLLLLDEIAMPPAGQQWTYNDTTADAGLSTTTQAQIAHSNDAPPAGIIALAYHLKRVWGAVGNTLQFSAGPDTLNGNGNCCFPPANNFVFPSLITRLWATSIGLLVFTVSDVYIVQGQGTSSSIFYANNFLEGIGLLNYDAFAVNGSTAHLMTSAKKQISLDPGAGLVEEGFPIGDQFDTLYDAHNTYVTWHESASGDTAMYVSDGSEGWFRMAPTSAPETGAIWSPRAIIVAGCKAVQSLEVTPGQVKLLIGPGNTPGPILFRDSTVFTDGGATYDCFATIGSITLAQPGQLAELLFITLDAMKTGSRATVGVRLDEIGGAFSTNYRSHQDPPLLPPSSTLFNDRYYMAQNQQATFCRHFQVKFTWPAEAAANELLSYTIFGALHQEKHQ